MSLDNLKKAVLNAGEEWVDELGSPTLNNEPLTADILTDILLGE